MIKILINEEEVVCANNLTIKEEMLTTSSTILKNCYPKSWELDKDYITKYYFPKDYSKCEIYDVDENNNETLIFCGVVKNTGNISLNPRDPHFVDLQILDFKTMLSEGETLNYVISGKTILQAIQQVISSISDYGFQLGVVNIQSPNEQMGAYSTLNKTAYDVFQYIAEITQSRWTTRVIDEDNVVIDFIDPLLETKKSPIEYTQSYFENNNIVDITFNYSTNDYRNRQIMISEEIIGNIIQTNTRVADGYSKTYILDNKIGDITGITINGQPATYATKTEIELGYSADFSYQPGENILSSTNILNIGNIIVVSYYPVVRGREITNNNIEISRIHTQTNRKGTISRYENRNDATSSSELAKIGQSYIKYKGEAEIILKIVSRNNLFNVGDIVEFQAPINDLTRDYMIKSKEIDIYTANNEVFYTFELTSSFNSENAINYFDNQRAKYIGNIGEGETIIRDIDIENEANIIFYDTNIQEISVDNLSTLDFELDAGLE